MSLECEPSSEPLHLLARRGGSSPRGRYRGTPLIRNRPPYDPTVVLFLWTYDSPRGGGGSHERGTPVTTFLGPVSSVIKRESS